MVNCLDGLVVKASTSRAEDPGFKSSLRQDFSGSSHTSDSKIGTPVATLPGRPDVSILWLGEVESLIYNFYLSALKIVEQIHPWDTLACCWDVKQPTNNNNCPWDSHLVGQKHSNMGHYSQTANQIQSILPWL